jgi:hypothetical protein
MAKSKKPPAPILPRGKAKSKAKGKTKLAPGPRTRARRKIAAYAAQQKKEGK